MNFLPFKTMQKRLESSKDESDTSYFFDLLLLGEFLTKVISIFLTSSINDDKERTRYRLEHALVRGNSIGIFVKIIEDIVTGPAFQLLNSSLNDFEAKELTQKLTNGEWQYDTQILLYKCLEIFEIKTNNIPVKSPLKNWFQNFVLLRNKTKGHGAPKAESCSRAIRFLEESIFLIINNFSAFKRNWVYLHRNLSGKYRISEITNKKDFQYLASENFHNFENGIYVFVDKPRYVKLFYSNSELSDFWITNGNLKGYEFETISYITDNRIYRSAKGYMEPVTNLPKSHTEGRKELDILGNVISNLPKPPDFYVTRKKLEESLHQVLIQKDRFPIITLLGRGGVGKTSLALNFLEKLANKTDRFDIIIWFSARDIDLLLDGPKQVQTNVLTIKDIANEYCSLMYDKKIKDPIDLFSKELTKSEEGSILFVFDNFETITNPIEVFEWLNTYIRNPNKILITSRISRSFKADYPIDVLGMSDKECRKLIENTAKEFEIDNLLTEDYINRLIVESDGHPYIIKIILGEVTRDKKLNKIKRIVGEQEKILESLFKRTFYSLSPAAKRVFLTLCSWNSMIPKIAIEAVLWRPENERMDVSLAIEELRQSSFIDILKYEGHEIISIPLAAFFFGKRELEVYSEKIKILADKKLLMEFGTTSNTNISSGLIRNIETKFQAISKRISSIEEFEKEMPVLEYIASNYPKTYSYIIDVYEEYQKYEKVKEYIREYLKKTTLEKEKLWEKLVIICKKTSDWDCESHALIELSQIEGISFNIVSNCANRINNHIYNNINARRDEYKSELLERIIEVMSIRIKEGNATDYSRLAWLLVNNSQREKAIIIAKQGLKIDPYNTHCIKLLKSYS